MRAALAVLALLLLPTNAAAASRTATLGQVSATITWTTGGGLARDLHVSIARAGATLVDQPVAADEGSPGVGPWARGVRVADLDGDGEPEVLVDAYTGGAHCCEVTTLWWFDGAGYQAVRHDWGNSTYRLGGGLLVGSDDAFDYAFTAYAFSRPPVEILGPRLQDITAQHPHLVRRDARRQLHVWSRYRDRAALAAYVADLHSLGRHRTAQRVLARALRRGALRRRGRYDYPPFGRAFVRTLDKLLRERGYMSRNRASAAATT